MSASTHRGSGVVEPVVLGFLILAAAALGWLHLEVLPQRAVRQPLPFDLRNPMLDARIGECLAIESPSRPAEVNCLGVVAPGVVLRPAAAEGPTPGFGDLRRSRPYLTCQLRFPPPGKGCDHTDAQRGRALYPLDGFGLPVTVPTLLQSIQPRWVERAGRHRFVYEVQLQRYDPHLAGPVILYLDPDQPVTGVVLRQDLVGEGRRQDVVFTPTDCP